MRLLLAALGLLLLSPLALLVPDLPSTAASFASAPDPAAAADLAGATAAGAAAAGEALQSSRLRDDAPVQRSAPLVAPASPARELLVLPRDPGGRPVPGLEVLVVQEDQEGSWDEVARATAEGPEAVARFPAEDLAEPMAHASLLLVPDMLHAPTQFVRLEPGQALGTVVLPVPACRELQVTLRDSRGNAVVPGEEKPLHLRLTAAADDDFDIVASRRLVLREAHDTFGFVATGTDLLLAVAGETEWWQSDWQTEPCWDLRVPAGPGACVQTIYLEPARRVERVLEQRLG